MDHLQQLLDEWRALQPLKPEDEKRLNRKFMLEFNYNSNHLEGNTLTYGQTKLLFMFGETSGSAALKDYEEMKAHNVGLELMKQEAMDEERPLTEQFIRELNQTILVQNYWKDAKTPAGVYKTRPNSVITATGEEFHYASPEETAAFMTDLVAWYNEEAVKGDLTPVELAALLHYRYIRIHPFEDENGCIARLLVNYVLHRSGIRAARGESIEEEDDFEKELAVLQRQMKKEEVKYFSIEMALDVLEKVHNPFIKKLKEAVYPAEKFFMSVTKFGWISKGLDGLPDERINTASVSKDIMDDPKSKDILENARVLFFWINLSEPKPEYKMNPVSIGIDGRILLEETYYIFACNPDKRYPYETYPSSEDVAQMIRDIRADILSEIKKAAKAE